MTGRIFSCVTTTGILIPKSGIETSIELALGTVWQLHLAEFKILDNRALEKLFAFVRTGFDFQQVVVQMVAAQFDDPAAVRCRGSGAFGRWWRPLHRQLERREQPESPVLQLAELRRHRRSGPEPAPCRFEQPLRQPRAAAAAAGAAGFDGGV